ncbi:MAG: hypothetical protein A2Y00_01175 [Omnitrophica WOR_2 bacterium GWF2_43_52]|nr:MAG: hypothetical protein A2062_03375 [Omnitrophica WOR_2 bacterium GWA2_44_7]OGX22021.1 MAG: hypothetical protein A2Y00_01175 [Omnitrophica WOR_2 bacterium GWF2_43_52]OGX52878.1 MAG: hypothetical protein A2460_03640 [Omnitrophica WOR_2 bacterium RIFOXYC2_FULL_43_9]HAH20933.1 hypothetical protein [Candidatus Omnitrophota bacterium]HBG63157.1 hypothetical protein [Candidatus Omnitrophota bacterium]
MEQQILKIFGQRLKRLRIQKGWSQEELGLRAGLHRTYVGSIERSERNISLLNIERIARALSIPVQLLVVERKLWGMESNCRKGEICLGMHVGVICKDQDEKLSLIISYMLDALKRKEKCVCVVTEEVKERIIKEFKRRGISVEKCAQWGQFILLSYEETYLKDGQFHSEKMVKILKNLHQSSLREGFNGLRITGEATASLMDFVGHKNFIAYEARINYFFPDTKALGLCLYDEAEFSKDFLLDVIFTHPKLLFHGRFLDNPYYKEPAIFLDSSGPKGPSHTYDSLKEKLLKK